MTWSNVIYRVSNVFVGLFVATVAAYLSYVNAPELWDVMGANVLVGAWFCLVITGYFITEKLR